MGKKKKKSRAQAAAARYEKTEQDIKREKAKERGKLIKKSAEEAQKKAHQGMGLRLIMPFLLIAAIVISALAFTIGPGLMLGK